jgi:hypothetical protein
LSGSQFKPPALPEVHDWYTLAAGCLLLGSALAFLAAWIQPPLPIARAKRAATPLSDPILHLEPERELIWSTATNQTPGVFVLSLHNTGLEDIDNIAVTQDYFVAQRGAEIVIKNVGGIPIENPVLPLLKREDAVPIRIDFTPHIKIMNEVSDNFKVGPSLRGVKVAVRFSGLTVRSSI